MKKKHIIKSMKSKVLKAVTTASLSTAFVLAKVEEKIFGSDKTFEFLEKGPDNKTFETMTSTVKQTGRSLYQLLMAVGIIGLTIAVIFVGISFATNKNAAKREETKSHMMYIAIGAVIIFGAMSILGMFKSIGDGLKTP